GICLDRWRHADCMVLSDRGGRLCPRAHTGFGSRTYPTGIDRIVCLNSQRCFVVQLRRGMYTKQCMGARSMIATGNPLAAAAANTMLQAGGSAVDAAIAADAVLGVVEPMATSIGGDLLATLCSPEGQVICYNGTGRAPVAMDPAAFDGFSGRRIPE